ncbi:MAG: tetratricopeptide repeat protein [Planctomycetes bacterium]|nr:tetratricopeptide repeat protein [Planctomycetota bacterium]
MYTPLRSGPSLLLLGFLSFILTALPLTAAAQNSVEDLAQHSPGSSHGGLPPVPDALRQAMMSGETSKALRQLEALIDREVEGLDGWMYLKARVQAEGGQLENALVTLDRIEAEHIDGEWVHRARFYRADLLRAQGRMAEAEAIYEMEAERLLSEERQAELGEIYLRFARLLSAPLDLNRPGMTPPDYQRARVLYQKVLELQVPATQRDEALWGIAQCGVRLGDWDAARQSYRAYLAEFGENLQVAGVRVLEVRLQIADTTNHLGQAQQARYAFEDLVDLLEESRKPDAAGFSRSLNQFLEAANQGVSEKVHLLEGQARYAIALTYGGSSQQLALRVAALESFVEVMSEHPLAGLARFGIAEAYRGAARFKEACDAYAAVIAWQDPSDLDQAAREQNARFRQQSLFLRGQMFMDLGEPASAIPVFQDYVGRYPNGSQWAQAQQAMIDAEHRIGAQHREEEEWAQARMAWQKFLVAHPLDPRARQITFDIGDTFVKEAAAQLSDQPESREVVVPLWRAAIDAWERLAGKYPNTDEASRALFAIGRLYEDELQELDDAIGAYVRCAFGGYADEAQQRLEVMTKRSLAVETPRVWRTNEEPKIAVQLRNSDSLKVRIYKLDLEAYFRKHLTHQRIEELDLDLIAPDLALDIAIDDYEEYKPIREEFALPLKGAGVWAVAVDDGERRATTLVVRSDLDMIVKSSRRELFVYVQNMVDQRPAPGVEVLLALPDPTGGAPNLHVLETGRDGVARQELGDLLQRPELRVLAQGGGHYASDGLSIEGLSLSQGLQPRGYVYPDRSAYRPGQRVHWRGVLREVIDGRFAFEAGAEYLAEVIDSESRVVRSRKLALSEFGTVHDELVLPLGAPLGAWTVRLSRPSGATFQGSFQVQEFKLNTVSLDLEFDQPVYYRGEVVSGFAEARYYYGEPIADRPLHLDFPDGQTLVARTDENGRVPFEIPTRDFTEMRFLAISAHMPEEDLVAEASVPVSALGYSIGVRVNQAVVLAGSSFDARITTSDAAGNPIARDLSVEVFRRKANVPQGWAEISVEKVDSSTDERAVAFPSFTLDEGGNYILRARGIDRFGNPIVAEASVFVSGDSDSQRLRILAERNLLPVGDDLEVQLINRTASSRALLTLEGERVLEYRILELDAGVNTLNLSMEASLAPNFRMGVALMDGNEFYAAQSDFELERRLEVDIQLREAEVRPGEEVVVDLTVVDELGQPVRTELSLAAVDESVFAQFGEGLNAIDQYFAQGARRSVGFQTTSSCEFRYVGTTREIAQALLDEERRLSAAARWEEDRAELRAELQDQMTSDALGREGVRLGAGLKPSAKLYFGPGDIVPPSLEGAFDEESWDNVIGSGGGRGGKFGGRGGRAPGSLSAPNALFAEEDAVAGELASWINQGLAFWTPSVITDQEGKAELRFIMPERSTEWRLTAHGVGGEGHFGQGRASLVSRAPFFVELRIPRALTEGDQPTLLARVHNLTESSGEVDLRLRILNLGYEQTLPARVGVAVGEQAEVSFDLKGSIPLIDTLSVELEANATFGGQSLLARAAREVPVLPWGVEVASFASGVLSSELILDLQLPAGSDYRERALELTFGSDLADLVIDSALDRTSLIERRHKRVVVTQAATASHLIGACKAMGMLEALGGIHSQAAALRGHAESLTATLVAAQLDDGGWNWSGAPHKISEPETSARVMQALAIARGQGIPVAFQALDRGANYLLQAFQQASQRENERKALLLHALSLHGRSDFSAANRLHRLRNELSPAALAYTTLALLEMDRRPMAVELAELLAARTRLGSGAVEVGGNRAFHRSRLEVTALAAWALQEALPQSAFTREAIDWLLASQPWFEGRGRGLATAAVAHWVAISQPEAGEVSVIVEIDGNSMEVELNNGQPHRLLQSGVESDQVQVRLKVRGQSRPYFQAALRAFTRDLKEQHHNNFRITRHLYEAERPLYAGKRVETGFDVLARPNEGWRNEVRELERGVATRVSLNWRHSLGEALEGADWPYMALRVPLPAGVSVLPDSVRGSFDRFQMRGNELVVYLGQRKGDGWLEYKLIGSTPGTYRVLPPRLEDLVDPSRFALGKPHDLTVLPRGRGSTDPYRATPDELYHLGLASLEQGDEEMAYGLLAQLYDSFGSDLRDDHLAVAASKLLFLAIDRGTPHEVVRYFEVLKEKNPELNIPFDKVASVGRAYRELEEYERALLVFRATVEESFGKDLKVAGTLEAQGEPSGAIAVLERLWLEFPDFPVTVETYLTLSDKLLALAPSAHEVPGLVASGLNRFELTKAGIALLQRFLAIYHADPLAPEAGLNLVAAFLDLGDFDTAVALAQEMSGRFDNPRFQDTFRYSEAVGQWYLGKENDAVRVLKSIVEARYDLPGGLSKPSENRELALYILAQIHHAKRKFDEAAGYYKQVEFIFSDAREVLASFNSKQIAFNEVTESRPDRVAEIELRYRNIAEAELLIYRVDLMTLYLRERDLSKVTAVNLAGIKPTQRKRVKLDSATGMREETETVKLGFGRPGAYLVICRGDELHTSGLVLVSDIELEIEEDRRAGRLRIQALDRKEESFARDVDVRVVGSESEAFVNGRTDPRGLFVAEGVIGSPTVIARRGEDHYAFYRAAPDLSPMAPLAPPTPAPPSQSIQQLESGDYLDNVFRFNIENQRGRQESWTKNILRERKGVSVGQTRSR